MSHQVFHQVHDAALVDERHLHVQLRELRLPIGTQILVAKAAHDLIIAIHARHHQQLLEYLRRLRQGEERTLVHAARYQIVARAFRGRLGEHRRLDVDETVPVQKVTHSARDPAADDQTLLHARATQVHVAITQPGLLVDVFLVQLEGWGLGLVEHRQ